MAPRKEPPDVPGTTRSDKNTNPKAQEQLPEPAEFTLEELSLLHYYNSTVFSTLDADPEHFPLWQDTLVQVSFTNRFLLDGVFAISALHKASTAGLEQRIQSLHRVAALQNRALTAFRRILPHMDESTSLAAFFFSSLTVIHSFALIQFHSQQECIEDLIHCFGLVRGVAAVLRLHWEYLKDSQISRLMLASEPRGLREDELGFQHLRSIVSLLPHDEHTSRHACEEAIRQLESSSAELMSPNSLSRILGLILRWIAGLSEDFISLLARREPVALVILAYFASMLNAANESWWLSGWNANVLMQINGLLGDGFRTWMEWPLHRCKVSGHEARVSQDIVG